MKNARLILVVRGIGAEQLPPIDGIYRSREFIEFLKLINAAYPAHTAIRLILGNHSAHISKETKTWLAISRSAASNLPSRPSTAPASILSRASSPSSAAQCCHIRVASKQELKDRIMAAMDEFNRNPVVHTWSYKLDQAA
jgi:hypothetical protein